MAPTLDLGAVALFTAFLAGMASFLSPCVLPLVPGYLSYLAGDGRAEGRRWRLLGRSVCFVAGFSLVFIALGASLSVLGRLLMAYRYELNIAAGIMVALAGLSVMGLLRMPLWLQRYYRFEPGQAAGPVSAGVMGLAFGFGWTPCIGPILAAILMMGASSASAGQASILLAMYALGLGVPFMLAACFLTPFLQRMTHIRRVGRYVRWFAGGVLVLMGWAMATGELARFAIWMLKTFPSLGALG